jgi:predicted TIM-barrel fold metal-dependent hydrolase
MALSPNQRIISADDHMDLHVLPPEVFQGRLPRGLRGRGPKVVDTDDGLFWEVEGRLLSPSGRKGKGLLHGQQHGFRPGQPDTRLEDMDRDGVYAHVIYSPMTTQLRLQDPVLRAACMIAYNDWVAEFCRANPDRLVPLASVPASSPQEARDELLRVAKLGLRGAIVSQFEGSEPLFEDAWHPFWDAAEEVGLPINVHLDSGTHSLKPQLGTWRFPALVAVIPMQLDEILAGMIFSGILERRPRVRFVMGEAGLGWIPYVIERLEHELDNYANAIGDHKLAMRPAEVFKRQVFVTYEDEKLGVEMIPRIGVGNVMWASDYPHGDSTWPHSRKALAESDLAKHGEEVLRKVACENCAELYGIE